MQPRPAKQSSCLAEHCLVPDSLLGPVITAEGTDVARPPFFS